jgi:hypothetical protein
MVLDESVLSRVVRLAGGDGDAAARAARALHPPNVAVSALPSAIGLHLAHAGPFQILEFSDQVGADVVFIEGPAGDSYENQADVGLYKDVLADVAAWALDPDASREIVHRYEIQHVPRRKAQMTQPMATEYRISSFCSGGDCVEVGMRHGGVVAVRDTKDRCRELVCSARRSGRRSRPRSGTSPGKLASGGTKWQGRRSNQDARKEVYDSMTVRCIERRKHEEAPPQG